MSKQHSTDFKLSAIELYIKLNSIREVSELLNCSKSSLHRWIERYFETGNIERKNYKDRGSIITNEILKYINDLININPTITLSKIKKKVIKTYKIDLSVSYLYYIIKYKLNLTNKQLKRKYYPEKKLSTLKKDKINFYKQIIDKGRRNVISIL